MAPLFFCAACLRNRRDVAFGKSRTLHPLLFLGDSAQTVEPVSRTGNISELVFCIPELDLKPGGEAADPTPKPHPAAEHTHLSTATWSRCIFRQFCYLIELCSKSICFIFQILPGISGKGISPNVIQLFLGWERFM